jgi:hypothetical protein
VSLWFSEYETGRIGRIGSGAPGALASAPALIGGGQQGTVQSCDTTWSTWASLQPLPTLYGFDGYSWLLDGALSSSSSSIAMPLRGWLLAGSDHPSPSVSARLIRRWQTGGTTQRRVSHKRRVRCMAPRPWRPDDELDAALDQGDLRFAIVLADGLPVDREGDPAGGRRSPLGSCRWQPTSVRTTTSGGPVAGPGDEGDKGGDRRRGRRRGAVRGAAEPGRSTSWETRSPAADPAEVRASYRTILSAV